MIQDKNISRKYQHLFLPPQVWGSFHGLTLTDGEPNTAVLNVGDTVGLAAVGSLMGVQFDVDDIIRTVLPLPTNWDFDEDIGFRVIWSDAATAENSVLWRVKHKTAEFGAAQPTIDGTLDDAIQSDADTATTNGIVATKWGTMDAGTIDVDSTDLLWLQLDLQTDANNLDPFFHGLEICYLPAISTGEKQGKGDFPEDA